MNDYELKLTRKDGSARNFHVYGQSTPDMGDIISLPVDGQVIRARISEPAHKREIVQSAGQAGAVEIQVVLRVW
jgi:hypothetical protein